MVPGLFFCGVHFLRKRRSALLYGVDEDAAIVAHSLATTQHSTARQLKIDVPAAYAALYPTDDYP